VAATAARKVSNKLVLAQGDRRRIGIEESSATPFKLPAFKSVPASLRIMGPCDPSHFLPPQYGTDAGKQLSEAERFYDVVVRTEFETDDRFRRDDGQS
jgi:hypothetical protein